MTESIGSSHRLALLDHVAHRLARSDLTSSSFVTPRFVPTPGLVCWCDFERAGLEKHPAVGLVSLPGRNVDWLRLSIRPFLVRSTGLGGSAATQAIGLGRGMADAGSPCGCGLMPWCRSSTPDQARASRNPVVSGPETGGQRASSALRCHFLLTARKGGITVSSVR